jgi:RNA polymerase sigma-70 factor (ECF subfamily)
LTLDEPALVKRARKGDGQALVVLLKQLERPLYATALAMLRSGWDALDAVQETMMEVCANISTLRDPAKFRQWVTSILLHKCHDRLRLRQREVPVAEPEPLAYVPVGTDRDIALLQAVRELNDEQRLAVALRFFLDLSYDQIAAATGWPPGTVRSRLNRALGSLRTVMAPLRVE